MINKIINALKEVKVISWLDILKATFIGVVIVIFYYIYSINVGLVTQAEVDSIVAADRAVTVREVTDSLTNSFYKFITLEGDALYDVEHLVDEFMHDNSDIEGYYLMMYQPTNTIEKSCVDMIYGRNRLHSWEAIKKHPQYETRLRVETVASVTLELNKNPLFVASSDDTSHYIRGQVATRESLSAYVIGIYYQKTTLIGYHIIVFNKDADIHTYNTERVAEIITIISNILK